MYDKTKTLGTLFEHEFPKDFPVVCHYCEKKYQTAESMQFHKAFEFGLCLEGQGVFFIGNQIIPFTKGNVSVIPAGVPHFVQSLDMHPSKWLFISVKENEKVKIPQDILPNIVFDKGIEQMLRVVADEVAEKKENYKEAVYSLFEVLFIRSMRLHNNNPFFFEYDGGADAIYPAIEYITKNYASDISIERLAEMCKLSTTQFRRRFKLVTKTTPLEYILIIRLKMASVLLLQTEKKISDIAFDVGYNTLSSFNRHFKQRYNISPKSYRTGKDD